MNRARVILATLTAVAGAGAVMLAGAPNAGAGVGVAICNQAAWCTVTASGDVTQTASQLAIGNVSAGTGLAVTQINLGQGQVGGLILGGSLRGTCAWSQYQRDWATPKGDVLANCPTAPLDTAEYVANGGSAVWSGCFPRCFGGVPMRYDRRCGTHRRVFCYSRNCEEYANFFPWTPGAHPVDAVRSTSRHRLDVRYLARYGDFQNNHPYYLVRDTGVAHGAGNWVFISGNACGVVVGPPGSYYSEPRHE